MTGISTRRARLLRLRNIEHRIAAARMAKTDGEIRQLKLVVRRLGAITQGLVPPVGTTNGLSLKSNAEMKLRLDLATHEMQSPIADAVARHEINKSLQIKAQQREDNADKMHTSAKNAAEQARAHRDDANRYFQKRTQILGEGI